MTTKPELVQLTLPKTDLENARLYLDRAINTMANSQWDGLAWTWVRDDVLRTLKFTAFLLGGTKP